MNRELQCFNNTLSSIFMKQGIFFGFEQVLRSTIIKKLAPLLAPQTSPKQEILLQYRRK